MTQMTQANEFSPAETVQPTPSKDTGFDIGSLDVTAQATFNVSFIEDSEGNPKSGFIVVGKNSDEYREAAHKIRVQGLMRASKRKVALDTTSEDGAESIAQAIEANDIVLACSVVTGWFGFANNGVIAVFDQAIARKMILKFPTWRQKVLEALESDANFIKG